MTILLQGAGMQTVSAPPPQTPPYAAYTINTDSPQSSGLLVWLPSMAGSGTTIKERVSNSNVNIDATHNAWNAESGMDFGTVLNFDHDGAARIDTGIDVGLTAFSYAIWVRVHANEAPENTYIVSEANGNGHNLGIHGSFGWFVYNLILTTGVFPTLDAWCHTVYTDDGTGNARAIYINGLLASPPNPVAAVDVGGRLYMGGFPGYDAGTLDGDIADLRVYDHALSGSDVAAMYNVATRFDLYKPL